MKLRIFTGAWGNYVDTFEKACAASLNWPKNREAIKDATWTIITDDPVRCYDIAKNCGVESVHAIQLKGEKHPTLEFSDALYDEMQQCIDEDATFLFALPDYVFGDGTVANMKALMYEKGLCIAVPNTRVLPETMDEFKRCHSNSELVSLAFNKKYQHQTWRESEVGKDTINSYYGGVCWKEIENGLIAVTHRLPSSYLCQFIQSDVEFFRKQLSFSAYDHVWPTKLIEEGRQRYVGSSDVAFIVEITEPDKNQSLTIPVSPQGPSVFFRSLPHHKLNHSVMTVFRKEPHFHENEQETKAP
jgi:hypothetical protein